MPPTAPRYPYRSPYQVIHGTPDPAVVGDIDFRTGRRMSPNVVRDASMSNTFRPEDALAAVDQRVQQAQGLTDLERIQSQLDRQDGGALYSSEGDRMTVPAALAAAAAQRRAREMQQPNVAAQARGGVSGRAMPNTSGSRLLDIIGTEQGNQDLRGGAGIANRYVQMGGRRTVEARERRAAGLMDLIGREQAGNQAMEQTRLEQATQLETARENTRGRMASAIGNMGALSDTQRKEADTNGDGKADPKERLTYLEKLVKLEQGTLMDDAGKRRAFTPGEALYRTALESMVNPQDQNGFDDTVFSGDVMRVDNTPYVETDRGSGQQGVKLPRQATLSGQPQAAPMSTQLQPSDSFLNILRAGRNDPNTIEQFERRFGKGSAAQYLQ